MTQESYSNWKAELQLDEGDYRYGSYSTGRQKMLDGSLKTPADIDAYIKSKKSGKKPSVQTDKAHYEPEGDLVDEGLPNPKVNYLKDMDPYDTRRQIRQLAPGSPLPPADTRPGLPGYEVEEGKSKD